METLGAIHDKKHSEVLKKDKKLYYDVFLGLGSERAALVTVTAPWAPGPVLGQTFT